MNRTVVDERYHTDLDDTERAKLRAVACLECETACIGKSPESCESDELVLVTYEYLVASGRIDENGGLE